LAAKTDLPVIHLDLHFWKPGWVAPSESEWRETQRGLLAGDAWIADGNYDETLDLRLERADTIVFLGTPWWVCAQRAFVRGIRKRPTSFQIPDGCDESAWQRLREEWRLAGRIWRQRRSEPEREREIISQRGQHASVHVLASKRAVREFLRQAWFRRSERPLSFRQRWSPIVCSESAYVPHSGGSPPAATWAVMLPVRDDPAWPPGPFSTVPGFLDFGFRPR